MAYLEVRPSNTAAIRLYQAFEFEHIGTRRGYYQAPDGREDAAVFKLALSGAAPATTDDTHERSCGRNPSRRTFAIISHPDAGKTTLTEKLLLFGGAIQMAGTVKGRKAARHATSDWMRLSSSAASRSLLRHAISVRRLHRQSLGYARHEDFSEDTYRTLTAVDSALMVIDCAKGVEQRTVKTDGGVPHARYADHDLHQQARSRTAVRRSSFWTRSRACSRSQPRPSPGLSHGTRAAGHSITCSRTASTPMPRASAADGENRRIDGLASPEAREFLGAAADEFLAEIELVKGATQAWDIEAYRAGRQTPVFFGSGSIISALRNCLRRSPAHAPGPLARPTTERSVDPFEESLTGFVFKIQANIGSRAS